MKRISIIIPVFKVEKYLNRCVDSIIYNSKDKLNEIEIILVDDGSPDKSPTICDEYAKKYDFVKIIHKDNGGVSSARNEGIKSATGEFLTFVDSDDYVNENFYKIFEVINNNEEIEIFMFQVIKNNKILKTHITEKLDLKDKENLLKILKGSYECCCNKVFKTEFIRKNKLEFPKGKKAEDLVFSLSAILRCEKFMLVDVAYYIYFQNNNSAMYIYELGALKDLISNHKKAFDMIDNLKIDNNKKRLFLRHVSKYVLGNIAQINFIQKSDQKEAISFVKKHNEIILRPFNIKAQIAYFIYKIFGLKVMLWFLKPLFRNKKR
jgi:glycosyltransferase involved in cell wall biosynthesis